MKARIIRIQVEKAESGRLFATSCDMPNLLVSERSIDALRSKIPVVIEALYEAAGVAIAAHELESNSDAVQQDIPVPPWVVVPKPTATVQ